MIQIITDSTSDLTAEQAKAQLVEEMTEEEFEKLTRDNRYHIEVPKLIRMPFETIPTLIQRQLEFRKELAYQEYQRYKSKSSEIF